MKEQKINLEEARVMYANGNDATKKFLAQKFTVAELTESFRDKFTSWEIFAEHAKIDPVKDLPYPEPKDGMERFLNATKMVAVMSLVLRHGRKHDWTDSNEPKYRPYFDLSSGSGLSYGDYDNDFTYTDVGSRHCFGDKEDLLWIINTFPKVYEDLMLEND